MVKLSLLLFCALQYNMLSFCNSCQTVPSGYWPYQINALQLQNRQISYLSSFSGYPSIHTFNLNNNFLTKLEMAFFKGANKVHTIVANSNQIRSIVPPPKGTTFPTLRELILVWNGIETLKEGDLDGIYGLQFLALAYNPVHSLEVAAVDGHITPGGRIDISLTPLACSCQYHELYIWAWRNSVEIIARCLPNYENQCQF